MSANAITIHDAGTGSTASILPSGGFNCFSFKPVVDGQAIEALWAQPGFGVEHVPDLSGIPILFPFGGRMTGGAFDFEGRHYETPSAAFHGPNAIHGFVLRKPWRVIEQTERRIVGAFQASIDDPSLLPQWPADYAITVSYEVAGQELRSEITIVNPDTTRLPFLFATHPYFQLSLGGGKPEESQLTIPASTYWELVDLMPTGVCLPVDGRNDLRTGPALAGRNLDDIYSGIEPEDGEVRFTVHDPFTGRTMSQITPDDFNCAVVYTHPQREAIAIEPYMGVPDGFRLEAAGISTGMKVLEPGETYTTGIVIRLD